MWRCAYREWQIKCVFFCNEIKCVHCNKLFSFHLSKRKSYFWLFFLKYLFEFISFDTIFCNFYKEIIVVGFSNSIKGIQQKNIVVWEMRKVCECIIRWDLLNLFDFWFGLHNGKLWIALIVWVYLFVGKENSKNTKKNVCFCLNSNKRDHANAAKSSINLSKERQNTDKN